MKIGVLVRTLNEAHRIGQFCEAYKLADRILVADGGSEDNTVSIAESFKNVEVKKFVEQIVIRATVKAAGVDFKNSLSQQG